MNVPVDKAGRIVLPKRVRERLGVGRGGLLAVEERPEGLLLKRLERVPSLAEEEGILVHMGKAPAGFDWNQWLDEEREARLREIGGL